MAMNSVFDLDAALTMDYTNNNFVTIESKTKTREESQVESKVNDLLIMMMPTDLSALAGVCTVCMEALDLRSTPTSEDYGGRIVLRCGHVYHESCIIQWLSLHNSCPLCRTTFSGHSETSLVTSSI